MRIQIVNGTRHDLKLEVFDIDDKHCGKHHHESHHEFVYRDYCHLHDCGVHHCNKHHHDDIHLDFIHIGHHENRHYDGHHHHNGYRHHDYCEIHGCHLDNCKHHHHHDVCEHHRCHYDECRHHHHYDEHCDPCHRVKRVRSHRDKTFEIEFGNLIYVKNIDHEICATFGFDKSGHLFYQKCDGIKCEVVKNNKHIQITFN